MDDQPVASVSSLDGCAVVTLAGEPDLNTVVSGRTCSQAGGGGATPDCGRYVRPRLHGARRARALVETQEMLMKRGGTLHSRARMPR